MINDATDTQSYVAGQPWWGKPDPRSGGTYWHFRAVENIWMVLMCPPKLFYIPKPITQLSLHLPLTKNLVSMCPSPPFQGKGICPLTSHITQGNRRRQALLRFHHLLTPHLMERPMPLTPSHTSLYPPSLCHLPAFWSLPALTEGFGPGITVFSNPSQQLLLGFGSLSAAMGAGVTWVP